MTSDLPYQVPLAGIAAVILVYFALRAWTYGVVRPVVSALSFGLGIGAGVVACLKSNDLLVALKFEPEPITTAVFGLVIGVGVFLGLRKIGHNLAEWMFSADTFVGRHFDGVLGTILSLVPAVLAFACLAAGIRIYGTFAELNHVAVCSELYTTGETNYPPTPYVVNLRNAVEGVPVLTGWLDRFDPYSPKAKRNLVGLALISRHYSLFLKLGNHKLAVEIYTQPDVQDLLEDPGVTPLLDRAKFRALLRNRVIIETSEIPEIIDKLEFLDMIEVLEHGLEV